MNKAQFFFANVKAINEEEKSVDVIASTPDKDRDGDVILPSAFKKNLKSFKSNPVILACHMHRLQTGSSPVIGSAIPETININDRALSFKMKFADTDLGNEYWSLYRDKHMRAFSVGFIPEKWEDKRDDNGRCTHRTYTQVELLETSAVPVPSNPKALARAKGYFDDEQDKDRLTDSIKSTIDEAMKSHFDDIEENLEEIKDLLIPDPDDSQKTKLGGHSDTTRSAGDIKPEQVVEAFKSILKPQLKDI